MEPEAPHSPVADEVDSFIPLDSPEGHASEESKAADLSIQTGPVSTALVPCNWSRWYKRWVIFLVVKVLYLTVTLVSDTLVPSAEGLSVEFGIGATLSELAVSGYYPSFCFGPLLWAPLSEKYGRRLILLICFNFYTILQVCSAMSRNAASLVISRLLSGFFASACLPLAPAIITDIWDADHREKEIGLYLIISITPSAGALLGYALIGKGIDWRGTCWVLSVIVGFCAILVVLTLRETYQPLRVCADSTEAYDQKNDSEIPNSSSYAPLKLSQRFISLKNDNFGETLARPYVLLYHEVLLLWNVIYIAIGVCLVNTFVKVLQVGYLSYPLRTQLLGTSCVFAGCTFGTVLNIVFIYPRIYLPKARAISPETVPPELRLLTAVWAAPVFAASIFWAGWTQTPSIHPAVSMVASGLFGASAVLLMQPVLNYVIDMYQDVVATALAWYIVMAYALITVVSVSMTRILKTIGHHWTMTLIGCVAMTLVPVPILLRRYGPVLRAKSRYSR